MLISLYIALAILPLGLAIVVTPASDDPLAVDMGLAAGLVGFSLLAIQVALGSRIGLLDRIFGLDVVILFHRGMGIFATLLLLSHPVLIAIGTGHAKLFGLRTSWQVDMGKAALVLLAMGVVFALWFRRFRVDYNMWRLFHKLMVVVLLLGFIHSILIGPDLSNRFMATYWTAVFAIALLLFLWQNIGVQLFTARAMTVTAVTKETHDTLTVEMKPRKGPLFSYRPGQFMFLTFSAAGLPNEEHPFTISSSPSDRDAITATIKQSGDFTSRINSIKPGDAAYVQGPFGLFGRAICDAPTLVFIAGGVGITPFHSMINWMRDTGDTRTVTLICGSRTEEDIIFRKELRSLSASMTVHHVLSRPQPGWTGMKGHIDADIIKVCSADSLLTADFYVCGPQAMMNDTITAIRSLGVPYNRIYMERFTI